jgi:hypothetical protein
MPSALKREKQYCDNSSISACGGSGCTAIVAMSLETLDFIPI